MTRALRVTTPEDIALIAQAIMDLERARNRLKAARSTRAAAYVGRALKSAHGAYRHADGSLHRQWGQK